MSELQKNLEKLALRLDRMGMQVAQAVDNGLKAIADRDVAAGEKVDEDDSKIDREEVEIEQECINLLALYQPTAIDLRRICCIIKVNSDLERIADIAARLGRRVKHIVAGDIRLEDFPGYAPLVAATREILSLTVRMLNSTDAELPRQVIAADHKLDSAYAKFAREALDAGRKTPDIDTALTLALLARSLERIGDHCTNIAEDIFFLITGDIIRHSASLRKHHQA
ncbi:MAG TPA: phosphate transport system regulatory protein PhoU [Phycisphaerales bacterium]|nr:phosphate transport system regulatory protein PhoU [Phycisphaerales bacterium]